VAPVRTLVGACIYPWKVRHAYLVTTSSFTVGAASLANNYSTVGFKIDLVAASDLLTMLEVYNEGLPLLNELTSSDRDQIVRSNLALFEAEAQSVDLEKSST